MIQVMEHGAPSPEHMVSMLRGKIECHKNRCYSLQKPQPTHK